MALEVPIVPYPLQIENGDFVMVEQDSDADIMGCVEAIARCHIGQLDSLPRLGLPDYILTRGTPRASDIRSAITTFEPRASLVVDSDLEKLVATITISRDDAGGR